MALDDRFLNSADEMIEDAAQARREGDMIRAEFLESLAEGLRLGVADFRAKQQDDAA